jgi:hypothetical protein
MTEAVAKIVTLMAAPHSGRNAMHSLALLMKGKRNKVIARIPNVAVLQSKHHNCLQGTKAVSRTEELIIVRAALARNCR